MATLSTAGSEDFRRFRLGWFSLSRSVKFLIAWLGLYAAWSFFVSNPFWDERSASAAIVWPHVMYLHGLLIGLVGLLALILVDVFEFPSSHTKGWILGGALVATVFAGGGGLFDHSPTDTVALWTQIVGFFALDEILITLVAGFALTWRERPLSRSLPFVIAGVGSASMLIAAIMGHLAGWLLEFGEHSPFNWPLDYARFIGVPFATWVGYLVTSHSHEMVIALIGTLVGALAWHYGYARRADTPVSTATRVGLSMVLFGLVAMTVIYVVAGFTQAQPPTLFTFGPGGVNGLAGDDLVTGVFVIIGGLVALFGFLLQRAQDNPTTSAVRRATLVSFLISTLTVVGAGYAIELHETFFGAGNPSAPGAANDAVFTFWHQDFAFFLIPGLMMLMYLAERVLPARLTARFATEAGVGLSVAFLGGLVYVFLVPALYGIGYFIIAAGFVIIAYATARLWWTSLNAEPPASAAEAPRRGTHASAS
jgi:hypothetical protein